MAAITKTLTTGARPKNIRTFDPRRDINQVADLVELCFADTLDQEGHGYLRQMRSAARGSGYLQWAGARNSLPLNGVVWEENGRVVGNLTLIPYAGLRHSYYLIANVAVHPDYRRRGIARSLTSVAIEQVQRRKSEAVWLHVRAENNAAGDLYRSLGFIERAWRTTWHSKPLTNADLILHKEAGTQTTNNLEIHIRSRKPEDWSSQQLWLKSLYPSHLAWHQALRIPAIHPGLWGYFYRLFNDVNVKHWSAQRGNRLEGVLTWQGSLGYTDSLWLAVDPSGDETGVVPLLEHARRNSSPRRQLSLDYPGGKASQAIQSAGYQEHQTLVWMEMRLD